MNRKERRRAQATSRAAPQQQIDPAAASDFREAITYLQAGEWRKSEAAHRRVLAKAPRHAPTLHHLGLIAFKCNEGGKAVEYIRESLEQDPRSHQAWLNLAIILGELKRSTEAIDACRQCVELQPESSAAFEVLGNLLRVAEDNADAANAYLASLRLKPQQPSVLVKLGEIMLEAGQTGEALAQCKQALELDPLLPAAHRLQQRILTLSQSVDDAEAILAAQSATPSELAKHLNALGESLRAQWRYDEAIEAYSRATLADPSCSDAALNMALAFESLGRKEEALASYQAGLAIEPDRAEAYANVGNLLRSMEMYDGAIQAFEQAIKLDSRLAIAHYNLAVTFKLRDRFEEARMAFAKAVEVAPDSIVNRFELANLRRVLCDWPGLDAEERECLDRFRARSTHIAPFQLVSTPATRADQLKAGRLHAATLSVPESLRIRDHINAFAAGGERIRVGFLSSDFFNHATALLLVEVLEQFDRKRFELSGYCFSPDDGSDMRRRIVASFDRYIQIGTLSDKSAAQVIRDDGIDILVDLKGYTRDSRPQIMAFRPAPIQVNYLGYPSTMGMYGVDYLLADAVVAPMEHQPDYSESIVHLPNCYQPNDRQRRISDSLVKRADFGLPEDAFVFCSFNNSYKLNAAMFDIWMPLLKTIPGSVMWFLVPTDLCAENLRREAAARGVDPDRLVFARRVPIADHLARHRLADLFLDALPCNAHTTTSDALWAGLPVLTALGSTFSGRVAASLLTGMGLPELIASSTEDYTQIALNLARDRTRLDELRLKIARHRETSALFDTKRYTRNIESAFETMVEIAKSGKPARPFAVTE